MIRATPTWRLAAARAGFLLVPALGLTAATAVAAPTGEHIDLYQDGVAVTTAPDGGTALLRLAPGVGATYLDGSRVLDPAALDPAALAEGVDPADGEADRLAQVAGEPIAAAGLLDPDRAHDAAAASRAWLASGVVPGADGPFAALGEAALLDLRALTLDDGAALAAPSPRWRYVWPRDASFTAAAFARTGHVADARDVLGFLARVQEDDGSFHARYLPDGSGVPDDRGLQSDGVGWVLWAADVVLEETPATDRPEVAAELRPLVDAATDHALSLVDGEDPLPPASSDYWEVEPTSLTLGTAGPLLAGLEAAADVYAVAGETDRATEATLAAARLRMAVERSFGSQGYPRHVTGGARDASTAFVLPPFQPEPLAGADAAWRESVTEMLRPAGGLAPGAGWRDDGISWTPQTTLYALAASSSSDPDDRADAREWLRWVDDHRTASGAIPEKVLADGSPAAVAPLSWSSALVVLALVELDGADAPDGAPVAAG
ncbi:glycoside hydrolase family 15 [Cellulosimicrobium cellulans]|uniref:Glycoside hydrolase family 15 n=1 Tax=Cellulosimicrobium composti TaxID=2672572 RepID=A0ABX0B5Y6_9MICO|nr:glycoside hydrolase family 15 [Cellulosimicrobium composti]NDO88027.1 glycoside hydrolase family 15 [Cellulosimicrobium composti]